MFKKRLYYLKKRKSKTGNLRLYRKIKNIKSTNSKGHQPILKKISFNIMKSHTKMKIKEFHKIDLTAKKE